MSTTIKHAALRALQAVSLLGFTLAGKAQAQTFTIEGTVAEPYLHAMIYFKDYSRNKVDSTPVVGGHFTYSDTSSSFPLEMAVGLKHNDSQDWFSDKDYASLFIDAGMTTVTIADSAGHAVYTGATNDEVKNYLRAIRVEKGDDVNSLFPVRYSIQTMDGKPLKPDTTATARNFQAWMDHRNALLAKRETLQVQYIHEHPDSYASILAITDLAGTDMDTTMGEVGLFNSLSDRVKDSYSGRRIAGLIVKKKEGKILTGAAKMKADIDARKEKMRPGFAIGSMAEDFTLNDVNGKPVKLSDFRGKYVLLDFWASWCGPCRQENPNVVKAYQEYKDKNFTVLGVALEQAGAKDKWLEAIKKDGLPWTEVADFNYYNTPVVKLYNVNAIPRNYLIDPSGKVVGVDLRGEALQNKLAELLAN